jgi:UDP-glucose 4-epimerase
VIATASRITGRDIHFSEADRRTGDPSILIGSSEKIQNKLRWAPAYNSLETIINTSWQWWKKGLDK